jgi:transposase-like protein
MCKVTISAYELMKHFPDEPSAILYLEQKRWNGTPSCPDCGCVENQHKQTRDGKSGYYRCYHCKLVYTVRTGTIFERSHISLDKWLYAVYLVVTARKGISSLQLSKEIGVTQKTAWFMLHRIRAACQGKNDGDFLKGVIEADEAYFGGKESNKHASKQTKAGRGPVGKVAVLGMRERAGRFKGVVLRDTTAESIQAELNSTIEPESTLYTDEHRSYQNNQFKDHKTVNHSAKQFVDGMAHTNGIESVWAGAET